MTNDEINRITVSMQDYVDKLEERLNQRFVDLEQARALALENLENKLLARNLENAATYLSDDDLEGIRNNIDKLQTHQKVVKGLATQRSVTIAYILTGIDLLLSVVWIASNLWHK